MDMKLEKLRKVKEKQEQSGGGNKTEEENNVVVLTRTDRAGNVVPLNESHSRKEQKGKRRKRHKMVTLFSVCYLIFMIVNEQI